MDQWKIGYSENNLSVGVHGVIVIIDPQGQIVRSLEGLATGPDGAVKAIGSSFAGDKIKGYETSGRSPNAVSEPIVVFSGSFDDVNSRLAILETATRNINQKDIPYEFPGIGSLFMSLFSSNAGTNNNSNTYIKDMFSIGNKGSESIIVLESA